MRLSCVSRRRPLSLPPMAAPKTDPGVPSGSLVLIVDDNEQNVELLQAFLEPLGLPLQVAGDGLQAVKRVEDASQPKPDLVLLDIMMPRMSGFEACRKIKAASPHTAVLMVTALHEGADLERAVDAGADDFLTKPVHRVELLTRVRSLLHVTELRKAGSFKDAQIAELRTRLDAVRRQLTEKPA